MTLKSIGTPCYLTRNVKAINKQIDSPFRPLLKGKHSNITRVQSPTCPTSKNHLTEINDGGKTPKSRMADNIEEPSKKRTKRSRHWEENEARNLVSKWSEENIQELLKSSTKKRQYGKKFLYF